MEVFRITLARYAGELKASGRAARWNSNDVHLIYTSSSQSLACLENVVHRNSMGLNALFKVMSIEIPDDSGIETISSKHLPKDWSSFENMGHTQRLGDEWVQSNRSLVLKVPSSIIPSEFNFLINPLHTDFKHVKLLGAELFVFDKRIKDK